MRSVRLSPAGLSLAGLSLAGLSLALAGCAHEMMENAAQTVSEGQAATANTPEQQIFRVTAERVVAGAIESLDEPAQREKLRQVISEMVNQAVTTALRTATAKPPAEAMAGGSAEGLTSPLADLMAEATRAAVDASMRTLIADLGGHGEGPLATSLAHTGQKVSAAVAGAAVGSVMNELGRAFPGCTGPDTIGCLDRNIRQLSRSAGVGFTSGVWDTIGWATVALAALLGLAAGLFVHWLWSLRTIRVLRTRTT